MALPRKLKHLNIFNAGNNWMGIAESVTLPKFTRKSRDGLVPSGTVRQVLHGCRQLVL